VPVSNDLTGIWHLALDVINIWHGWMFFRDRESYFPQNSAYRSKRPFSVILSGQHCANL